MIAAMNVDELLDRLWSDYVAITPQAQRIHDLLAQRGERFSNDHVALRTFDDPRTGLDRLAEPFLALGWSPTGEHRFEAKRLRARSYSHPEPGRPRIFISELCTAECGPIVRQVAARLVAQVSDWSALDLLLRRPTWAPVRHESYLALLADSEYAAWLAAFGIRVNHFTVAFDDLRSFDALEDLNAFLRGNGFELNGSGRQIQGGPETLLEQSSTVASAIPWAFADDEVHEIPSCYYEFARRYVDPRTGRTFDGFVTTSADKIFESTDVRRGRVR